MIGPLWSNQKKKRERHHSISSPSWRLSVVRHFLWWRQASFHQQDPPPHSSRLSLPTFGSLILSKSIALLYSLSLEVSLLPWLPIRDPSNQRLLMSTNYWRSFRGCRIGGRAIPRPSNHYRWQWCTTRGRPRGRTMTNRRLWPPPLPFQGPHKFLSTSSSYWYPLFKMKIPGSITHISVQIRETLTVDLSQTESYFEITISYC